MRGSALVALAWPIVTTMAQSTIVPLNEGWVFHQEGVIGSAEVPGTVHGDLLRHGLIPDPHFGDNIDSIQWISDSDWVYTRTFIADETLLRNEHIDLVFEGLDTFAEVRLNDSLIGRTTNMFRSWEFPIKALTRPGSNELEVTFRSTILEGEKLRAAYDGPLPHDNDPGGTSPHVRKAACQFGWDFSPRLVTCGIWRPVALRCWNTARIDQVSIEQAFIGTTAVVGVRVFLDGSSMDPLQLVLDIDGDRTTVPVPAGGLMEDVRASLSINDAQRWWPNGEGEQVLYPLRVELLSRGRTIGRWEKKIGLRTVSLDQHEGAFTFVVNNVPLFMKGTNLVPPGLVPSGSDNEWVRLVRDMQLANMNMVRVWAGGLYPPDAFFDACDTAGILVWQDIMVANVLPNKLVPELEHEVREQLARIRHHPSLAHVCGNNEVDVAWMNWGWQDRYGIHGNDSARAWDAFKEMMDAVGRTVEDLADVPHTPTSPLSNWGNAEGLRSGDLHYWGVWHGDSAFSSFAGNVGRFVSEYGFQSYPDSGLLARYMDPEDLQLGSAPLARRQRSYKTDRPVWEAIEREFGVVPKTLGEFIGYSQLVQAEAYRQAIWAHRTAQPHCMGTLFWQLNDRWAGPSWSAIDVSGRWKPAMHEVQRGYAPIVLQLAREGDRVEAQTWNDGPALKADLLIQVVGTDRQVIKADTVRAEVGHGLTSIWSGSVREWSLDSRPERSLLIAELLDVGPVVPARAIPLASWGTMEWEGPAAREIQALQASPGLWRKRP